MSIETSRWNCTPYAFDPHLNAWLGWRETYGFALVLGGWRLRRVAGPRRLDGTFLPELVPEMDSEPDRQQPALHDHDRRRDMD